MQNDEDETHFVTIGSLNDSRQMKHLNGNSSSESGISYLFASSSSLPYLPSATSRSICQPFQNNSPKLVNNSIIIHS